MRIGRIRFTREPLLWAEMVLHTTFGSLRLQTNLLKPYDAIPRPKNNTNSFIHIGVRGAKAAACGRVEISQPGKFYGGKFFPLLSSEG
jgi:hypothetical protein